mgnify:CR=1 FL=1
MEQSERRDELKRILFLRKYDTINNLAKELSVSTRTIRRDLVSLSLSEAIYTVPGDIREAFMYWKTLIPIIKDLMKRKLRF